MVFLGGHPAKYWPPTIVCVCVCVCVRVLLCLVFIIAVHLGNKVIFYQLSPLTLQVDLGVDPNKSTGVDLGLPSRVELVYLAAVDPP